MAYNEPGVRVVQEIADDVISPADSALPTCIIGPLYSVITQESAGSFDPISGSDQSFNWPELPVGSLPDLQGIVNGVLDNPPIMAFYLKDAVTGVVTQTTEIAGISTSSFTVDSAAAEVRDTVSCAIVNLNGTKLLYSPTGDFSTISVTDVFADSTDQFVVGSRSATRITVADATGTIEGPDDLTVDTATLYPDFADDEQLNSAASSVSGRTRLTFATGGPWAGTVSAGDAILGGVSQTGLTSLAGAVSTVTTVLDGITFGVDVTDDDVVGLYARVINSTATTTVFSLITGVDVDAGTLTITDSAGTDNDIVSVTIYRLQLGYVDSIASDDTYLDAVFPTVVADTDTFAIVVEQDDFSSIDFYPQLEVLADYRTLRRDLCGEIYSAYNNSSIAEITGFTPDYRDGLSFFVSQAASAQDTVSPIFFVPVDLYPDDDDASGLVADQDELTGYQDALIVAESSEIYTIVPMSNLTGVRSAVVQHVNSMSDPTEKKERRAIFVYDVALGDTESNTGVIYPGKTANGLAPSGVGGNSKIYDENVDFVSEAEIGAGDRVFFSSRYFNGNSTALVTTTDSEIHLNQDNWTVSKQMLVASMSVTTAGDIHAFTGASSGNFTLAAADDYIEATISGVTYRMRIISVLANGTGFSAVDEVAGALSFSGATATNVTVIRSDANVFWYAKPLSKSNQVTRTIARKTVSDRRFSAMINQLADVELSATELVPNMDAELTASLVAAKRSGNPANQEVTNLYLGGSVVGVDYGHGHFSRAQLNDLAAAGFTLVAQEQSDSLPYIRDMITSSTSGQTVLTEEMVTAIADKISKDLRATFVSKPGNKLSNIDQRTLGIRYMQSDAFFRKRLNDGYLNDYAINSITQDSTNKRQINVSVTLVIPVAEKEIEFTLQLSV